MDQQPSYLKRTSRGKHYATVKINGKLYSLGRYDSPESWQKYEQYIAQWQANQVQPADGEYLVEDAVADYLDHAAKYYVKDGEQTTERYVYQAACQRLYDLYGELPAAEFGPSKFKTLRQQMINAMLAVKTCNHYCLHIRKVFQLAASDEKIPGSVFHDLNTVPALVAGRCEAKVPNKKPAAQLEHIEMILPHVSNLVADMIRIQAWTGMRPGELCGMQRSMLFWENSKLFYRPHRHKNQHHNKNRIVKFGPKAEWLLRPYMRKDVMFPIRTDSYRRAIHRGCQTAGIPKFSPQQIRKTFAEKIRKFRDLEAAQTLLGHSSSRTTELYERLIDRHRRHRQPDPENLGPAGMHLHRMTERFTLDPGAVNDPSLQDHWSQWTIARWLNRDVFSKRCDYGRFHSLMTQTPRTARSYLLSSGPLSIVDVSACQPLLLGILASTPPGTTTTLPGTTPLLPYVVHFLPNRDCRKWIELCQNGEIYQHLHDRVRSLPNLDSISRLPNGKTIDLQRQSLSAFKRSTLIPMLDTIPRTIENPVFRLIRSEFPTIGNYVVKAKKHRHQGLACLLQRLESEIMVDGCGNHLRRHHPDEPVQTIHDAILCRSSFADSAIGIIKHQFRRLGLDPRIKRAELN